MLERLESVKGNFKELTNKLTNPEIIANQAEFQHLAKKRAEMESLVSVYDKYVYMLKKLEDAKFIEWLIDDGILPSVSSIHCSKFF